MLLVKIVIIVVIFVEYRGILIVRVLMVKMEVGIHTKVRMVNAFKVNALGSCVRFQG